MADIAHTVPASIKVRDGSSFGFDRPGLQVTPFDSGAFRSRDWSGHDLRTYDLDPALWQSSDTALEEWSAFWHQINGGADAGYIMEPSALDGVHREVFCGGLAAGTQTTFPIPVVTPTSVTVFVDGVPQESSAYTVHSAGNLLSDEFAVCADAADYTASNGTTAASTGVSLDALSCIKMTPGGGTKPALYPGLVSGVSVGEDYTAVVAILVTAGSAQNYRTRIRWYDSTPSALSYTSGADVSVSAGAWTVLTVSGTAPASTANATVFIERNDTVGTDPFYVDCFALAPGDYTRWHLPSQAPGLIEFATAPSSGARITATAEGQRVTRCRFTPGTSWSVTSPGHASSRSIRATEVVEV